MSTKKDQVAELAKHLQSISEELKTVDKRFKDVTKKSKAAVKSAHLRSDEKNLQNIRQKMGLK